jgi:hypothetical protein
VFRREGGGIAGRFSFEGRAVEFAEGDSVAAALLAAGVVAVRESAVSGAPRGPFCLMGVCFDCLVEIGGVGRQACLVAAEEGLVVRRLGGRGDA